jgi:hypothetical protein
VDGANDACAGGAVKDVVICEGCASEGNDCSRFVFACEAGGFDELSESVEVLCRTTDLFKTGDLLLKGGFEHLECALAYPVEYFMQGGLALSWVVEDRSPRGDLYGATAVLERLDVRRLGLEIAGNEFVACRARR